MCGLQQAHRLPEVLSTIMHESIYDIQFHRERALGFLLTIKVVCDTAG